MNYHYGRIRLNQALYAQREGNSNRAKQKLIEAESMLNGWTGIYSRIAVANIAVGNEDKAILWIKKGLNENPNWSVNLPAFYFLRDNPKMKSLIKPDSFSVTDWETAMGMLSNLGRELEVIELTKGLIDRKIESSYLNYIIGRSYFYEKENGKAKYYLEKALKIDSENIEAQRLLQSLND
jgi:tetratricopeptide (TPR) repeat protein